MSLNSTVTSSSSRSTVARGELLGHAAAARTRTAWRPRPAWRRRRRAAASSRRPRSRRPSPRRRPCFVNSSVTRRSTASCVVPSALGHLLVAQALRHQSRSSPVVLGGLAPSRQSLGDRGVDRAPARRHLADRADELVALRDPVLQQVGEPALALAEQRDRVRLVVVGREHDDARCRGGCSRIACAQSIPSSWKFGRHLDVGHHHVGTCSAAAARSDGASSATPTTSMSS